MRARCSYVFLLMAALAVSAAPAKAATWNVPGDFGSITAALGSGMVTDGDTVLVGAGTYSEGTIFVTKNVTLLGAGAGSTTINGGGARTLLLASTGLVRIEGFTITGGFAPSGAGMTVNGTSGGSLEMTGCLVTGNTANNDGAGVDVFNGAAATFEHCTFSGNTAIGGSGGAISISGGSASVTLTSCILWGDSPDEIGLINGGTAPTVTYSDVQDGLFLGDGNVSDDPDFTDAGNGDYTLQCGSPCAGTGEGGSDMGAFPAVGGGGSVTVSGTVTAGCTGALAGVTVDLLVGDLETGDFYVTSTDADGNYTFADVAVDCGGSASGEISILIPLGYEAVTPANGEAILALDADKTQDFSLACLDPTGLARSKGYWKHQASVYVMDRGNAQESSEDMSANFPVAIFDHFHENLLNSIAVEGVTYMAGPTPLDLGTILETLRKKDTQEDKAKQQYLALLLNMASGKVMTWSVVSADGATASQAIQYVADLLNNGDPADDQLAKDICETINHASLVGAGVIPDTYADIAYARNRLAQEPLRVFPNPGSASRDYVFSFAIPQAGEASLEIYDVAGRRIAAPMAGGAEAGRRELRWDGRALDGRRVAQGVYFARLVTGEGAKTVKFVHLAR